MKNILTIGGGTGTFTILKGIKEIPNINLTVVVPSSDSGGSSDRLSESFQFLPPGDMRQAIIALAETREETDILLKLFNYRFDKGDTGLIGHNFGNLFLTALLDINENNLLKALDQIYKLLDIKGKVYPVSINKYHLIAEYEDGKEIVGEHNIDEPPYPHDGRQRITNLTADIQIPCYDELLTAIANADYIIISPGDLYTSILANFTNKEFSNAVKNSKAKIIMISNLVTKYGQTYGFKLSDFVSEIERYIGKPIDTILYNEKVISDEIIWKYKQEYSQVVENNMSSDTRVMTGDFVNETIVSKNKADKLKRSLLRHDPFKLKAIIEKIISTRC